MLGGIILIYYPEAIFQFEVSHSLINFILPYIMIWAVAYNHEGIHLSIQEELANLARTDNLTGCLNRRALTQDWNNISQHTGQYLLHIDLDDFKAINDCYGHEAGDLALKTFTSVAQRVLENSQCYRVGGEEFCLLFRSDSNNDALELSQNLGLTLRETTIHVSNGDINVTLSGGLLPLAANEVWPLDVAIKAADEATYQAKNAGKNRIVFCPQAKDN
nr:GGDEF domain-containing protein [Vibrio intestinalis]